MLSISETIPPLVRVVDDDAQVRGLVTALCTGHRLDVETYSTAEELLSRIDVRRPGCIVTDFSLPGLSGIEMHERLLRCGVQIPIIVISGNLDVSTAIRAMKNNPVDVLEKPFLPRVLLNRIESAIERDRIIRQDFAQSTLISRKLARLTNREREVLELIVAGHPNKRIARTLDITEKTVEAHRARLMRKLEARNVVELTRIALKSGPVGQLQTVK